MKKNASMKTADQDIPELKRDELGKGVRGKYLKHFQQVATLFNSGQEKLSISLEKPRAARIRGRQQAPSEHQINLQPLQNKRKQLLNL
ncbi:MAG: hypothetical protein A3F78_13340 [Burkholderiales bacterium RIFCSPLOWO2_12_FULL_61_40]|nr:MAG: hypothetical protein A3F78_13340 [Burkholderiales bacterium RIFCSPLOWO2_12_FULL_61_40]